MRRLDKRRILNNGHLFFVTQEKNCIKVQTEQLNKERQDEERGKSSLRTTSDSCIRIRPSDRGTY